MHDSLRTEQAYVHWVRAYVRHHGLRHPAELSGAEVEAVLSWLAAERQVAPSPPPLQPQQPAVANTNAYKTHVYNPTLPARSARHVREPEPPCYLPSPASRRPQPHGPSRPPVAAVAFLVTPSCTAAAISAT